MPPDPQRPELYLDSERVIREYGDEYWIVGVTVTTIWETAWALRGYERLLMDLVLDPDLAERILEIPFRYHLAAAERLVSMGVDMLWTGDDIGAQRGMLINPDTWRRFFKPRMAELVSRVKAIKPDLLVAYHTDGDVREVIPDLIEIGIDVLNPVQPACMDPAELKRDYGDRLLFWGSIDEQGTLPFGTPQDVADEIRLRVRDHRQGWRTHPGAHAPRPAGHAAGELLGHGGHHPRDRLPLIASGRWLAGGSATPTPAAAMSTTGGTLSAGPGPPARTKRGQRRWPRGPCDSGRGHPGATRRLPIIDGHDLWAPRQVPYRVLAGRAGLDRPTSDTRKARMPIPYTKPAPPTR